MSGFSQLEGSDTIYPWTSDSKNAIPRRSATLFCEHATEQIQKVKTALDRLDFDTRIQDISEISFRSIAEAGNER